jgi:hypothetical protein
MALEGNARDFGLSEILQLVALQKKTGMLAIEGERTMVIYFQNGLIVSTRDRRKMAADPLREYIARYGILGAGEMTRLDRIQEETKIDLADILLSEKKFSEDELREIFAEQIQESIQEILTWPKSRYKFVIGGQALQGVRTFGGMKVEALLMESMRRIDELAELRRLFPSDDTLLKRIEPPETGRPEMETAEEDIYELLVSPTTLGELVPRARMARFCTMESLKLLLEKGLLQVTPVETPEAVDVEAAEEAEAEREPSRLGPFLVAAGALALCLAVGEIAVPRLLPPGWSFTRRESAAAGAAALPGALAPDLAGIRERLLERTIREELEEHLALTGAYPPSLDALAANGFLTGKTLERAKELGLSYRLERGGKRYSLERERT